jgi:hypothetical protein
MGGALFTDTANLMMMIASYLLQDSMAYINRHPFTIGQLAVYVIYVLIFGKFLREK